MLMIWIEQQRSNAQDPRVRVPHQVAPSTPVSHAGRPVSVFKIFLRNFTYPLKLNARVLDARAESARRRLNANDTPQGCHTPSTPRPETSTFQSEAVEHARTNSRWSGRESRNNDLQDSPRRRHPRDAQDENCAPGPSEGAGSMRRAVSENRVSDNDFFQT